MRKDNNEIEVTFRYKGMDIAAPSTDKYPSPRKLSACFYGGDPEECIAKARKLFGLDGNWVLDEVKGEDRL